MKLFSIGTVIQKSLFDYIPSKLENSTSDENEILGIQKRISLLEKELNIEFFSINKKIIEFLYERSHYNYGCYDFALYNEFNIGKDHYSIKFLIKNEIDSIKEAFRFEIINYIEDRKYSELKELIKLGYKEFFTDKDVKLINQN